jgi:hypothetical protein
MPKCGQYVDKRELRDVIFHDSDHNRQALALSEKHWETDLQTTGAVMFSVLQLLP